MRYQFRVSSTKTSEVQFVTVSTEEGEPRDIKNTLEKEIGECVCDLVARNDGSGWEPVN